MDGNRRCGEILACQRVECADCFVGNSIMDAWADLDNFDA